MFWESISGRLAERLTAQLVTPPTVFWAAGAGAWILAVGWQDSAGRLARWFDGLSGAEQVIVAAGALLGLVISAVVVEQLAPTVLRLLEGYWPRGLGWMRRALTDARSRRIGRAEAKLGVLEAKRRSEGLTPGDALEFARLDRDLRRVPSSPELRMPTRLGDALRSGEAWPREKYGLDAVVCWPRLWLVLPEQARVDLAEARRELDRSVVIGIWGALLIVWTPLTWWALAAAGVVSSAAYWRSLRTAEVFADFVESAFDVFRESLYAHTGIPAPASDSDERRAGELLTQHLWRGEVGPDSTSAPGRRSSEPDAERSTERT